MAESRQDELLTLGELALYLKLAEKTIHRMLQKGEIPCFKVASQWRFSKRLIDQWLKSKLNTPPQDEISRLLETEPEGVPFSRMCSPGLIIENLEPDATENVLLQLIQPLVAGGYMEEGRDFLDRLLERERIASTALGRGVAFPHIRNPQEFTGTAPVVVVGRCPGGVDFHSLDGEPTYLFFLIFSTNMTVHLRIISRLNRILLNGDLIEGLLKAASKEEIFSLLVQEDLEILGLENKKKPGLP
ncbi:MAG: PTS sugar transporter subunit IIA [Spirochaetales bacterium]|jgi:PTS system nitrogen regulatory IIA component|nr:PTS sugar transporter subunit IIA [Spirochaetales bacterium]